jgi:CBS domain-containing protein
MRVRDLLQASPRQTITSCPAMPIRKAMALLVEHKISCLPVLNDDNQLVGIISDKDIFHALHEKMSGIETLTVGVLMATELIVGVEDDEIGYIAAIMTNNRIRHVPIVDGTRLIGLLSIGDIVKTQMSHIEIENRYLWQYINGSYPG